MADLEKTESLELNKPAEGDIDWHTPLNENWDILDSWLVGMVLPFAGKKVPKGFLLCDGRAVSREDYKRLFDAIGTTYGEGDGSTTFNLRDARGEFIRGWDHGRGVDTGRNIGSYQADAYESHTHTGSTNSTGAHTHAVDVGADIGGTNYLRGSGGSYQTSKSTSSAGAHSHTVTINASGSTETRPRNIAFMTCIKY